MTKLCVTCEHPYKPERGIWLVDTKTYLVLLHDLPAPAGVRVGGHPLKDDILSPIQEGPISQVGVTSDPATVCCAPVDIARLEIKDVLGCDPCHNHVPPCKLLSFLSAICH